MVRGPVQRGEKLERVRPIATADRAGMRVPGVWDDKFKFE